MSPSRASQVFSKLPVPRGGDGTRTPDSAASGRPQEGPGRCVGPTRATSGLEKKGGAQPGRAKIKPILLEVTSFPPHPHPTAHPGHLSPIPSSLPARGMTPKPEPPRARSWVGGRAATKTTATSHTGKGTLGGRHGWDWEEGEQPNLGRQVRRRAARMVCA